MGTDTTTNALFAPGLLLILQIVRSNIYLLENEVKVNDTDFFYQVSYGYICNYHHAMNTVVEHSITALYYHT